jgi:uracil-DNA glycosylase family 4
MSKEYLSFRKQVKECKLCTLSTGRTFAVPGEGPVPSDIMFVGEAPGFNEDQQGTPFVGRAGKILDGLLNQIDLDRNKVYITNIVKCRPTNNRNPKTAEIDSCRPYFDLQIKLVSPKVIVGLGRFALNYFAPGKKISEVHGEFFNWNGVYLFPMYHPAAVLHQGNLKQVLENDIAKIPKLLQQIEVNSQILKT